MWENGELQLLQNTAFLWYDSVNCSQMYKVTHICISVSEIFYVIVWDEVECNFCVSCGNLYHYNIKRGESDKEFVCLSVTNDWLHCLSRNLIAISRQILTDMSVKIHVGSNCSCVFLWLIVIIFWQAFENMTDMIFNNTQHHEHVHHSLLYISHLVNSLPSWRDVFLF